MIAKVPIGRVGLAYAIAAALGLSSRGIGGDFAARAGVAAGRIAVAVGVEALVEQPVAVVVDAVADLGAG